MKRYTGLFPLLWWLSAAVAAERPNVLLILADDLGKEWVGCYGSEQQKTPNIDKLAATGLRFENVYATPLCTPTRHLLLTGRYPFRTGWIIHHDVPRWGEPHFDWNREITIARVLKSAGYASAIAGKWQLNDLRVRKDALKQHGFDEHCLWPGFETGNPPSEQRYFDPFIQANGERAQYPGKFGPDIVSEFALDFITRHKSKPFFLYYAMILPHGPMTKTPHNLTTEAKGTALHPGMVDYVDYLVGLVLGKLDELKIRDNTLVIFAADNGSPGLAARRRGLNVKGGKGLLSEPGICVPFIINWPGHVPAGKVTDELVDFSDVFPTLAELANAQVPADRVLDGRSLVPLLLGRPDTRPPRRWLYSQLGKLRVFRDKRYKLWSDGRFYDLIGDSLEEHDLATSADPRVAEARQRLSAALNSLPPDAYFPFPATRPGSAAGRGE